MPDLDRGDVTLHYEIDGNGPPLLLIAGMASDSASWAPLVPLLTPHFTIIRPDNRCTGRTRPMTAPVSIAHYADDCTALIDYLETGPVHVLGHSMGGMIALRLARNHSDLVQSLTLAASAPLPMARNLALFRALIDIRRSDAAPDLWLRAFFPWLFAPIAFEDPSAIDAAAQAALTYPHAQSTDAMERQLKALAHHTPEVDTPGCPVQALLASDDLLLPTGPAKAALADMQVRVHVIDGAGHSIHWDAPETVADYIRGFAAQHAHPAI